MAIVSDRPSSGVRVQIERDSSATHAPFAYEGYAHFHELSFPISLTIDASMDVAVTIRPAKDGTEPPADLTERVRLLVRAACPKREDEGPPPFRIVRWRPDKLA